MKYDINFKNIKQSATNLGEYLKEFNIPHNKILEGFSRALFYKNWNTNWKFKTISILSFLSIIYFCFHVLWAFNYYRKPLFEKMNIKREYSDAQLLDFTKKLILKTNQIQYQITKDTAKKVRFLLFPNIMFSP